MEQKIPAELGTGNIGKLLLQYAVPSIIAMTASSLYNMIDSIFIGRGVGANAISGLALTFPLMNMASAFGTLVGVGATTLFSVKLGQKDYDTARRVLGNVMVLNFVIGLALTVVTLSFLDPILYFFGASENTIPYARDYMKIILAGNVVTHMYFGMNSLLRSAGHPSMAMGTTIFTVAVNIILAPIFIFACDWGIEGAAIATVLAQTLALLWLFKVFSNKSEVVHIDKSIFRLKKKIVMSSLAIGMAPFLMNLAACLIVILINLGLKKHGGDMAIGAYGIVNRLAFLFVMIVMGLTQGMQPIVGYNYGARNIERVIATFKKTAFWGVVITSCGFIVGELFPRYAVSLFTTDGTLTDLAVRGLRIVFALYPIVGFQIVTSNFFQSIGMVKKSILLSLSRQCLILIPCLFILPEIWGQTGVWVSIPIADGFAGILAAVVLILQIKSFRRGEYKAL